MDRRYHSNWVIVGLVIVALITFGCASTTPDWKRTTYGTWNFSQAEVEMLPRISILNILSSISESETQKIEIFVKARNLDKISKVTHLEGQENIYVRDADGNEVKINIAQITEIQSIRQIKITPRKKTTGEAAADLGEGALYAPTVPVAIATLPFLSAMGLNAGKNDEDKGKAQLAYGGMSKDELTTYIGEPDEKYHCKNKYGGNEVWVYKKGQVLRGGRALFIGLNDGKVYHTSHNTTFFKDSCSLMEANP